MFTITAEVTDSTTNEADQFQKAVVHVTGQNMSDELVFEVAKQAFALEAGWDVTDVARSITDWDIVEAGTSGSLVSLTF